MILTLIILILPRALTTQPQQNPPVLQELSIVSSSLFHWETFKMWGKKTHTARDNERENQFML